MELNFFEESLHYSQKSEIVPRIFLTLTKTKFQTHESWLLNQWKLLQKPSKKILHPPWSHKLRSILKWKAFDWLNSWAKSKQSLELNKTLLQSALCCRILQAGCSQSSVLWSGVQAAQSSELSTSVHQKHQTCLSGCWSKQNSELQFKCSEHFFGQLKTPNEILHF